MSSFLPSTPTLESCWRAAILFGRNSASYKFALAQALLDLSSQGQTFLRLEDLAAPYSAHLLNHLAHSPRQGTAASSRFLDACLKHTRGEITKEEFLTQTVQLGFVNVIDAFHNVNGAELPVRFYIDERKTRGGILLTDDLLALRESLQCQNLPFEVEARWRLVETAWSLNLSPSLLVVQHDLNGELLFVTDRTNTRINVTSSIDALNGYQKGKCFYCYRDLLIDPASDLTADVDHFFPHTLTGRPNFPSINLNGVWNLVLACRDCNRGSSGKLARLPALKYLQRLHTRNSYLIDSHHPLRDTLINQTGSTPADRLQFLKTLDFFAIQILIHRWSSPHEFPPAF